MDIGAIIFIVVIILSIAQKMKEGKEQADAKRRWKEEEPAQMSERARKTIHGEPTTVREATRKGHAPSPNRQATEQRAKEVFESLFGAEVTQEIAEEEADWETVEPARRRELAPGPPPPLPQHTEHPAPGGSRGADIASHDSRQGEERLREERRRLAKQQELLEKKKRQEAEIRHREEHHKARKKEQEQKRKQQQAAQRSKQRATRSQSTRSARPSSRKFLGDLHEVRKAIVFAEVLGPPKALEDQDVR